MDVDSITPLCLLTDSNSMADSVKAQLRISKWYTMQMSATPNTRLCIHKYTYPFYRSYCRLAVGAYLLPLPVWEVTGKQVSMVSGWFSAHGFKEVSHLLSYI